ncbi:MAG: DUF4199 family protein [Hymenobacter sp.]|nr:DUF4199 family protein [Hymenobacter sp.]
MPGLSFLPTIIRYGLLLGVSLCLYTTLMWLTRLDTTYLAVGQYLDIAVILLPISLIAAAIRQLLRRAPLRWWQRLGVGVGVGVVAELVYRPYLALYHAYLNPTWFSFVVALKKAELSAAGQSAAHITAELARLQAAHVRQAGMFSGFWVSALVLPALVALLTLPFWHRRPAPPPRQQP